MDAEQLSRYFSEMGRKGGKARAQRLTPEQRKEIAAKASKVAAEARGRKPEKGSDKNGNSSR